MPIELNSSQKELLARVRGLARTNFASRALECDRAATFPREDFDDLFQAGLLGAVLPSAYGGLQLGPYRGDVLTLWLITKEIAKADLSLARCWEGHANSLLLLDGMGTEEQKAQGVGVTFPATGEGDRKSTRLNSSHQIISYAVFSLKKKITTSFLRLALLIRTCLIAKDIFPTSLLVELSALPVP